MIGRKQCMWILWLPLWASIAVVPARQSPAAQVGTAPESLTSAAQEALYSLIPVVPVSLELRDTDLKILLRTLGKQFGLNLLVHEAVRGQVSVSFTNVLLLDVLESLARMSDLVMVPAPGRIIEILPASVHKARMDAQAALTAQVGKIAAGPPPSLITQKVEIQYAYDPRRAISEEGKKLQIGSENKDLTDLVKILEQRLSKLPGSGIAVLARGNALLVTDTPQKVEEIVSILKIVDVPSPTVGIEAKITEVTSQGLEDLGIQWGGVGRKGELTVQGGGSGSNTTGTPAPNAQTGLVGLSGSNFILNLPAAISASTGGLSLAFILGRQATRVLDVQLSLLQSNGRARLLAAPRVTTPNHERALIKSGREIPFVTNQVSGGVVTSTVQFKEATIELEVTPHVIGSEFPRTVALDILVSRKEADFSAAATVQGNPSLINRTLFTRGALVREGETAVLGGLLTDDTTQITSQVPLLGNIPVLGALFKHRERRENALQLMIFISPSTLSTPLIGTAAAPSLLQK